MDEVTRRRLQSIENSRDITPVEVLRMVLDDIERGEISPDGILVLYCTRPEDGEWVCGSYKSNLPYNQELVQIELARERCLRAWIGERD